MRYRTCLGCKFEGLPCGERDVMRAKVAGLGITSVKWKCDWRRPAFKPGDLVTVCILMFEDPNDYGSYALSFENFDGIFIRDATGSTKKIVYIQPGTIGDEDSPFDPKGGGTGFCKLPRAYIKPRDGVPEHVCEYCENPSRILGHQEHCRYHPSRHQLWKEFAG